MDIEYLKRFIAVGQCLNYSKAAEELFISQSTLSHSISTLEKQVGAALLIRNTKSVTLTRAGEIFLAGAEDIVARYHEVILELREELHTGGETLCLGYVGPACDHLFAEWIPSFRRQYPDVKVTIQRYDVATINDAFERREIDMGFVFQMDADNIGALNYTTLESDRFYVVIHARHPLAKEDEIDLRSLQDEPFLICKRSFSPNYYDHVLAICAKRGLMPRISQEAAAIADIYRMVDSQLGVAILPYSETRAYDDYRVKFLRINDDEPDLCNTTVVAWKYKLSPVARKFRELVESSAAYS